MHWANFIYKFAPWRDLGCWKDDTRDRAVPHLLVNLRSQIDWFNIGKTSKRQTIFIMFGCLFSFVFLFSGFLMYF